MHAMSTLQYEDDILERLATLETPGQFVAEVVVIIEELVDRLIRGAFRQDDYAVKYAIEPLLNQEGPLSDLGLRLKLLLALGLISPKIYHDLEVFLGLHDLLSVITSYSIHYTKLYDSRTCVWSDVNGDAGKRAVRCGL